jgi:integrase/recombinase XerD
MKKYVFSQAVNLALGRFQSHLAAQGLNPNTIRQHSNYTGIYLTWLEEEGLEEQQAGYREIMAFVRWLQQEYRARFINRVLLAVRHYYRFLEVETNPAAGIYLKGHTRKLPETIVDEQELKSLYEHFEANTNRDKRNRVMLGLMVFQALTTEELGKLQPGHIRIRQAKIQVPSGKHSNARTLDLQAVQLLDMQEYLLEVRPRMLTEVGKYRSGRKPQHINTEEIARQLFFSENGSKHIKRSIWHLFRKIKKTHPKITSGKIIRQSVITHWLKGKDIRRVQYMAGHRYVSSTQRYRDYNTEELSRALQSFHPLND